MCGIVSYIGKEQPLSTLLYLLGDNDERGSHSTGVYIDGDIYKAEGRHYNLTEIIAKRDTNKVELFIGHTRFGTHGVKTAENTHPYKYGKYIGCHNGVLQNHEERLLHHDLEDVDVDSKAIFSILEKTDDYSELGEFGGTINAVWTESNGQLYVYRRNNPLYRYRNEDGIFFSSKKDCLTIISGNANKVKEVTKDKLFIYAASGELIESIEIKDVSPHYSVVRNWDDYKPGSYNNFGSYNNSIQKIEDDDISYEDDYWDNYTNTIQDGTLALEKLIDELELHEMSSKSAVDKLKKLVKALKNEYAIY